MVVVQGNAAKIDAFGLSGVSFNFHELSIKFYRVAKKVAQLCNFATFSTIGDGACIETPLS